LTVHTIEHFVRWEAVDLLARFHRWLKPGGRLVTEQPDLDMCIQFYLHHLGDDQKTPLGNLNRGFAQFYGNQWDRLDYETHRYVWTAREFKQVLREIGFKEVTISYDAKYHLPERDMWVEAVK
jgi:predicted SAM-dependent methyltransferase